jgi:hypothetical protein
MVRVVLCVLVCFLAQTTQAWPEEEDPHAVRVAPHPASTLDLVHNFRTAVQERHAQFGDFRASLEGSLNNQIVRLNETIVKITEDLEKKEARSRILRLQVGDAQRVAVDDDTNTTKEIWVGANTLVECATAREIYNKRMSSSEQTQRVLAATLDFIAILKGDVRNDPAEISCLNTVEATLVESQRQGSEEIASQSPLFNTTRAQCVAAQQRILSDSGWLASDEIPLLEVLVAMKNELVILTDEIDHLRLQLTSLTKEIEIKNLRLTALSSETRGQDIVVQQQHETIAKLSKLLSGLKAN